MTFCVGNAFSNSLLMNKVKVGVVINFLLCNYILEPVAVLSDSTWATNMSPVPGPG